MYVHVVDGKTISDFEFSNLSTVLQSWYRRKEQKSLLDSEGVNSVLDSMLGSGEAVETSQGITSLDNIADSSSDFGGFGGGDAGGGGAGGDF